MEGDAGKHLAALHERFSALEEWEPAALEAATRAYAEETGAKLGNVAQPLRAALTGAPPRRPYSTCCMCSAAAKALRASPIERIFVMRLAKARGIRDDGHT